MDINRKHEAILRLLWLVDNEMSNLPQKDEDYDGDQSWIDEFNREMEDAFSIVKKMLSEVEFDKGALEVAKRWRSEDSTLGYDESVAEARKALRAHLKKEAA